MLRKVLWILFSLFLLGSVATAVFLTWGYFYITRDLPKLNSIDDYRPPAVSYIYASDGTLVGEFFHDERRYPVKLAEVPVMVRNCFIAAEDADFYHHKGIDPMSILRAAIKNLETGSVKQGGSTITQQVVKNLLLTPERKIQRKIKEAILSYQLEKRFTKDQILELYLNQIFFGSTAYGIKAAAWVYFKKEPKDLTLGEAALLAGLPQGPSKYSPFRRPKQALTRRSYVISQMLKAGFVTVEEAKAADAEELKLAPQGNQNIFHSPYYVTEVRSLFSERWKDLNPDTDGLKIYTALDLDADRFAATALRRGLRETDKRRGWRGPIGFVANAVASAYQEQYAGQFDSEPAADVVYPALVTHISPTRTSVRVLVGNVSGTLDLQSTQWANRFLDKSDQVSSIKFVETLRLGDVIEVVLAPEEKTPAQGNQRSEATGATKFALDQTPDIEGATILIDPHSGKVKSLIGGYSYQRSVFNRATQSLRQPGSAFKPIVYLTAVDGFGFTPATIVSDAPRTFKIGDQLWTPGNFDKTYSGDITLRTALEKSRNLVSADIISQIGVEAVIQYAYKLGIESRLGRNLSLSLGSSEVTLLELARSYGVFPARGVLMDSVFITKIVDRYGTVIYDYETEKLKTAKQVIKETSAFILTNMMKGVVERGTGTRVKALGRPVAGKTGTSNDQMDTWFIGFTPEWVSGVWVGFDVKKTIGEKETGGKVAAPIFLNEMRDFLAKEDQKKYEKLVEEAKAEATRLGIEYTAPPPLEPLDFSVPEGVDPFWVDKDTGLLAEPGSQNAIYEYFVRGTEPSKRSIEEADPNSYLNSPDL